MKSGKIHDELATRKNQITLQRLAQQNRPLFILSCGSLAASFAFLSMALLLSFTQIAFSAYTGYLALGLVFAGAFILVMTLMIFGPKGLLCKQYSKELEQQNLEELSVEELQKLIDFHRSQKNFDAADHASKYLILKLENNETDS